jgi:hypothetical protein
LRVVISELIFAFYPRTKQLSSISAQERRNSKII